MFIRCRQDAAQLFFGEVCDTPGFITYEGHCFPLPVNGECPSVPGFEFLVPMDVVIDDETVTICVPDCSSITGCEASCIGPIEWKAALQACGCEEDDMPVGTETNGDIPEADAFCGCPDPLVPNLASDAGILDGSGLCILPEQVCYDLGLDINIQPYVCDQPNAVEDTISIIIKPAPGQRPGDIFEPFVDAITIEDLENCELIDGTGELLDLIGIYGPGDRAAFVADATGCIVIDFVRDPTQPTTISFLSNDPIEIPACPRSFDPCSCRPENITDATGTVLFWYDELTFVGNPSTTVTVQSSNGPGFLDTSSMAPHAGLLGTTDAPAGSSTGTLVIPFFRTPGAMTNVTLVDGNGATTTLMSTCDLSVDVCANIVPTLGEWAIMILGLLMMICSVIALRTKPKRLIPLKQKAK